MRGSRVELGATVSASVEYQQAEIKPFHGQTSLQSLNIKRIVGQCFLFDMRAMWFSHYKKRNEFSAETVIQCFLPQWIELKVRKFGDLISHKNVSELLVWGDFQTMITNYNLWSWQWTDRKQVVLDQAESNRLNSIFGQETINIISIVDQTLHWPAFLGNNLEEILDIYNLPSRIQTEQFHFYQPVGGL